MYTNLASNDFKRIDTWIIIINFFVELFCRIFSIQNKRNVYFKMTNGISFNKGSINPTNKSFEILRLEGYMKN